jgi:MYXO-CTERM domain-containing protein
VAAAEDADVTDDEATIEVSADFADPRTVTVSVVDDDPAAPLITSTAVTTAVAGAAYEYDVEASGLPVPAFSLAMAPAGMTIDATTGVISWLPASIGSVMVTVQADNGVAPDAQQMFGIEVSADMAPSCTLTLPAPGEIVQGTASELFGDGTDDVGTVRADFSIDGVLGYTDINSAGHYHFGGSHVQWDTTQYADGAHTVRMTVYDTSGQSCFAEVDVTVANGVAPEPDDDAGSASDAGSAFDAAISDSGTTDSGVASDAAVPDASVGAGDADVVGPAADASASVDSGAPPNDGSDGAVPEDSASRAHDGCNCSAPGAPTHSSAAWPLLAMVALWIRIRRRLACLT